MATWLGFQFRRFSLRAIKSPAMRFRPPPPYRRVLEHRYRRSMWPQCQQGICSAGCGSPPGRAGPPFRCVFGAFFQCCRVRGREIVPRVDLPCSGTRCFPAYRINKPAAAAAGLPLPLPNAAFFPTPARLDIEPSLVLRRHSSCADGLCLRRRFLIPLQGKDIPDQMALGQ